MRTLPRWLTCWWMSRCHRCLMSMCKVHHERNSPWWGMHYGWYEKGCSNMACAGWIEPMRSH